MGPLHRAHIHLHPQARGVGDLDAPVFELQGCLSEVLAVLPDVVGVDGGDLPRRGGSALDKGGQGDVEVVIGVDAPGQTPVVHILCYPQAAVHGPGMSANPTIHGNLVIHTFVCPQIKRYQRF